MLPLDNLITKEYTSDELNVIKEKTKNFRCDMYSDLGYYSVYTLLPLALLNPDKGIISYVARQYSISAVEANETYLRNLTCSTRTRNENQILLSYTYIKRGNSFIYKYLEEQGYTFLDRISLYLQIKATHKIKVYRKDKHIAIVTNEVSEDLNKRIFSAFPLLYKDDFNWDEETIQYFKNVLDNDDESLKIYKAILKRSKLLENIKKDVLKSMLDFTVTSQKRAYQKQLDAINSSIAGYETELASCYNRQRELQAKITFFNVKQDIAEIADYILNNPYIVDYYARDEKYFIVAIETPLEYVDVSALKKMLANPTSYLYPHYQSSIPASVQNHEQDFILMLKDLFITGKYKVYTRAEIVFDFENKKADPLRYSGTYSTSRLSSRRPENWKLSKRYKDNPDRCITPHMHIEYYDCWSGNKTNITKTLNNNDIVGALDIAISTTKDINVNDGTVFSRFINNGLYNPYEFTRNGDIGEVKDFQDMMPGNQFKTIYDPAKKCFRTFDDIFQNDYIKGRLVQTDIEEDFSDFII